MTTERAAYVECQEVEAELSIFFEQWGNKKLDWITFVGSGEPTLNTEIGRMITWIKENSEIPVSVITNGSLLYCDDVRTDLMHADAVMPSLDAGNEMLFRRINRAKGDWEQYLQGLVDFSQEYSGKFWLEVMLLHEINTSYEQLSEIAELVKRINPDEVHLALPTRPPAEKEIRKAAQNEIFLAKTLIGKYARVLFARFRKI